MPPTNIVQNSLLKYFKELSLSSWVRVRGCESAPGASWARLSMLVIVGASMAVELHSMGTYVQASKCTHDVKIMFWARKQT